MLWECSADKFFKAKFTQSKWRSPFIFDAKQNSTSGRYWSGWNWISDRNLSGDLNVLDKLKADDQRHRAFNGSEYLSLPLGRFGGLSRYCESPSKKISLSGEDGGLPEQGGHSEQAEKPGPPIRIGFFLGFMGIAGGFFCAFLGGQRLYDKRLLLGSALIGGGCLLLALSFFVVAIYGGGPV